MKRIFHAHAIALMTATLACGGALAQDIEGITVQASRVEATETGYTSTGLPVLSVWVEHQVPYADLDLTSTEGMAQLKSRVRDAALHGCREIDQSYRFTQPNNRICTRLATKETIAKINELVAAN